MLISLTSVPWMCTCVHARHTFTSLCARLAFMTFVHSFICPFRNKFCSTWQSDHMNKTVDNTNYNLHSILNYNPKPKPKLRGARSCSIRPIFHSSIFFTSSFFYHISLSSDLLSGRVGDFFYFFNIKKKIAFFYLNQFFLFSFKYGILIG